MWRAFGWAARAFIFLFLFAFALNNQHEVKVNGFFGMHWTGPMVFAVLAAFALGAGLTLAAVLPALWRQRQALDSTARPAAPHSSPAPLTTPDPGAATRPSGNANATATDESAEEQAARRRIDAARQVA